MIYFEDLELDKERYFGSYEVTREEVLDFARKYDPQPFHLSDEAAAETHFGRLAASLPKWVFAAASSERWKGWGSYLRAKSMTSSRVTS